MQSWRGNTAKDASSVGQHSDETVTSERRRRVDAVRLALLQREPGCTLKELLTATLDQAETLTGSRIAFFHFVEDDQNTLSLQAWSTNTVERMCTADGAGAHYPVEKAGAWAECVRTGTPTVHNDYASLPGRKGMPPGHAPVVRELVVPVLRGGRVCAVLGVGNKPEDYDGRDVEDVVAVADLAWDIAARKRALEALALSEGRYRALFDSITDGVVVVDMSGLILESNEAYRSMLGYGAEELSTLTYSNLTPARWHGLEQRIVDQQILPRGWSDVYEKEYRRKDGTVFPVELRTYLLRDGDRPRAMWAIVRDVTERKRAADAMRAGEQRYRDIIDLIPDAIFVNRGDRVVLVNPAALALFGAERPAQLLGRSPLTLFDPAFHALIRERIAALRDGSRVPVVRHRIVRLDGKTREVEVAAAAFRDAEGFSIQVVLHDVTEQLRREEELRIQQSRLDLAVRSGRTGLWDLDLLTGRAWRTIQHDRLFGYDELQPEWTPEVAVRHVIPEDRPSFHRAFHEAAATGRFHYELRIDPATGPRRWIEANGELYRDESGRPVRMMGTVADVTDRREAEEQARAAATYARSLLEASLDPLVTISPEGTITDVNAATESATGVPRSRLVGTDFADYFTEPERAHAGHSRVLVEGSVRDFPLTIRHVDGRLMNVLYNASVLTGPDGRTTGVFAAARDVTELRALQAQVYLSSRMAALGTLMAGVAHEVNNPLAAALSDIELALHETREIRDRLERKEEPLDLPTKVRRLDEVVEELSDALQGARRIDRIVKDLKVFARPGLDRSELRLAEVVEKAVRWLPASVHEVATVRVEDGGAPYVLASPGQIEQVVLNLVTNAARATQPGRPNPIVVRVGPGRAGMARVDVVDQGAGIAPDLQQRIFEPFFTTREVGQGTGLGLAVCHSIVTAHGGTLTVESQPGVGSTFRVELPAADAG